MSEPKAYTLVTGSSGGIGEAFARRSRLRGSLVSGIELQCWRHRDSQTRTNARD